MTLNFFLVKSSNKILFGPRPIQATVSDPASTVVWPTANKSYRLRPGNHFVKLLARGYKSPYL